MGGTDITAFPTDDPSKDIAFYKEALGGLSGMRRWPLCSLVPLWELFCGLFLQRRAFGWETFYYLPATKIPTALAAYLAILYE